MSGWVVFWIALAVLNATQALYGNPYYELYGAALCAYIAWLLHQLDTVRRDIREFR